MRIFIFFIGCLFLNSCHNSNEEMSKLLTYKKCGNWGIIARERESGISEYKNPVYSYMFCNDGHYSSCKYNTDTKTWEEADKGDVITSNRWKFITDSVIQIGDFQEWKINKISSDTLVWNMVKNPAIKEKMVRLK